MSDESKLETAAGRGRRAAALLADDLVADAFKALEDAYTAAWRSTTIEDVAGREKLFLAINIVGKVKDHLAAAVANGNIAEAELRQIAEAAERKKLFDRLKRG